MNTYVFFIRAKKEAVTSVTDKEIKTRNIRWMNWTSALAKEGKLAEGGNHLTLDGMVVEGQGGINAGPYMQGDVCLLGYILVHAVSYDEAIKLTKGCPVLEGKGTSIEVREISSL
ncbi:YciI family protein [Echinicola jeungdonensis]|uniref:YciI family protein n=1 Tax=Echinicola jeungdonensis TaxID=709343 RepID=A0ABV5J7F9_9BACT|nr:YciI family protein [Echinicola jeungdonensis]MDN3669077.1 YciI family protein [Echinicola jeungdonensis]